MNRFNQDLGDDPEVLNLGNAADLTYTNLAANLPIINNYNQWRIDKVVTHWRIKNRMPNAWRGDLCNHAIVYKIPNDSPTEDGSLENLAFTTNINQLNNVLLNYNTYAGMNFKKVSFWKGSYAFKPYVTEIVATIAKNTTAAPLVINDIRRNYKKSFRYASSQVRYEAPIYMVVPGITKNQYEIDGTLGTGTTTQDVQLTKTPVEFPQLEVYSDVYVTVKQYKNYPATNPRILRTNTPQVPIFNEINADMNAIREDVKEGIVDQIANSHPVLGAVAAIAGIRNKRPRDEFKM